MSNLRHRVEKLRLRRGDVLVCRDPETMHTLAQMKFPALQFQVPIVCAPLGVEAIPLDDLKKIIRDVDETSKIILPGTKL